MARRASKAKIVIRPLEPSDDPAAHGLMLGDGVFPTTGTVPSLPLAALVERNAKYFTDDDRHSFAAVIGDRLVGIGGLILVPRPRMRHCASLWLEVHQDFHGRGVGTALVRKLLDLADRWLGLVRVELHVNADNDRAIRLYERFGFEKEGRLRANFVRDGAYVDSFVMGRLRPPPRFAESRPG
jgi:putative acetyltransferase